MHASAVARESGVAACLSGTIGVLDFNAGRLGILHDETAKPPPGSAELLGTSGRRS